MAKKRRKRCPRCGYAVDRRNRCPKTDYCYEDGRPKFNDYWRGKS